MREEHINQRNHEEKRRRRRQDQRDKALARESIITISVDDLSLSHVRQVECNWPRDLLLRHLEGKLMCRKREKERERRKDLIWRNRDGRENGCTLSKCVVAIA